MSKNRKGGKRHGSRGVPLAKRRIILWFRQHGCCCWCKKMIPLNAATIEHLKFKFEGGTDRWENIAMACKPCNNNRHPFRTKEEAREHSIRIRRLKPHRYGKRTQLMHALYDAFGFYIVPERYVQCQYPPIEYFNYEVLAWS